MSRRTSSRFIRFTAVAAILIAAPAHSAPLFHGNAIHYIEGIFPNGSAAGDFDGDGHLDFAIVVTVSSAAVMSARGHGDGTFDPMQTLATTPGGWPKAVDLNGDGFADLVVSGGGGLAIRYGGPAGLGPPNYLVGGSLASVVDVADVSGDGRLDLVTGNGTNLSVRLATGPTTYGPEIASPSGLSDPLDGAVVGDLDEDSVPDVVVWTTTGAVAWMKGHGDGTFDPATAITTTGGYHQFLADLNGDHHLDLVTLEGWYLGDGHGNFGSIHIAPGTALYIEAVGDVTGDGAPDLVYLSPANPSLVTGYSLDLYRNDGSGNFARTWSQPMVDFSRVSVGDVNGDGLNDLIAPNESFGTYTVHLSNGDGTFGNERHYLTGNRPSGIVRAEVTGDGLADLVTSDLADNTISVLPGLPGGQFGPPIHYTVGGGPNGIATGDLNGDGRADFVTSNGGSNTVSVLLGQSGGGLGAAVSIPVGVSPAAIAIGDINRDGHLDVVVVGNNTVQILNGDGAGGLALGASYPTSSSPFRVVIGDLDGDVWPDVAVHAFKNIDVLRGNGSGGLLAKVSYGVPQDGRDIAIGDINGDGIPDVVQTAKNHTALLLGTGGGALSPLSNATRMVGRALAIQDDDGDGKPDVFVASDWENCAWLMRNLGGGALHTPEGYGTERGPSGLVVADLDGDGTLDIATSDGDTSLVSVLLGISPGPVPALATLVSAEATANGVHIEWLTGANAATVERSENGGAWTSLGPVVADGSGRLSFADGDVRAGSDYVYRLGFAQGGQTVYAGLVSVHVPAGANLALAASPNPAQGVFGVSFTLPDARPARLELYNVAGRRLLQRNVGAMGPGTHVMRLGETSQLPSGVYWMRLVHPERTLTVRAALIH